MENGTSDRSFPHELGHVLLNTFGDHRVAPDNLMHIDEGSTGNNLAKVQCDIVFARA
jgi:hypothetical protein